MPQRALQGDGQEVAVRAQGDVAEREQRQPAQVARFNQIAQLQQRAITAGLRPDEAEQGGAARDGADYQPEPVGVEIVVGTLQDIQDQEAAHGQRREAHRMGIRALRGRRRGLGQDAGGRQQCQRAPGHQPEDQRPAVCTDDGGGQPGCQRHAAAHAGCQRLDAEEPGRAGRDQVHRQPR
ncbi:hypothetical protein D3C72_1440050 [compost metagenome]